MYADLCGRQRATWKLNMKHQRYYVFFFSWEEVFYGEWSDKENAEKQLQEVSACADRQASLRDHEAQAYPCLRYDTKGRASKDRALRSYIRVLKEDVIDALIAHKNKG